MSEKPKTLKDMNAMTALAMSFYLGEPCRVCGKPIEEEELTDLVFAGYSSCNKSRAAHKPCWNEQKPKEQWAFPEDATT